MGSAENHTAASWQPDPFGRHEQRWWNGADWTEKVRSSGTTGIDPPGIDANPEHAHPNVPATPIIDANQPVSYGSHHLPRALLVAVLVLLTIVILVAIAVAG